MRFLSISILLLLAVSCAKEKLNPLRSFVEINPIVGSADIDFCTLGPKLVNQHVKFIFVLDISGSNAVDHTGPDGQPKSATDPDRSARYDSAIEFMSRRADDPAEFFTLIEFSGNSAQVAPGITGEYAPFVPTTSEFSNILQTQKGASNDAGGTPYLTALDRVIGVIREDATKAIEKAELEEKELIVSKYVVIFLSDGQPTDEGSPYSAIFTKITEELMRLPFEFGVGAAVDSVNMNTGYYYRDQDYDQLWELLQRMAELGQGEAYRFDTGSGTIDYDQLTKVFFRKVSTTLTHVTIENVNSVWDLERQMLMGDRDGDMLSDAFEKQVGSDPNDEDTDKNGVTDGAEAMVSREGLPCKHKKCLPSGAFKFNGCWEHDDKKDVIMDKDRDLVRDCEETLHNTNLFSWDSNGNNVTDRLLLKFGLPATTRDDPNNPSPPASDVDTDFDGSNNALEIDQNTSPLIDNHSVIGLKPTDYKIRLASVNPFTGQQCYHIDVNDIAIFYGDDKIRLWIYENEKNLSGREYLRILEKKMNGGGYVHITEADELGKERLK